jgi:hypothetical protein
MNTCTGIMNNNKIPAPDMTVYKIESFNMLNGTVWYSFNICLYVTTSMLHAFVVFSSDYTIFVMH